MAQRPAPPPPTITEAELLPRLDAFVASAAAPLVVITGPTASGKTVLSIRLAQRLGGEVINGDSRQFYRGMDLGTAKVTEAEMAGVPHHLLSFLEPDAAFTVAEFKEQAEAAIRATLARGHVPLLVGGSGLFLDAICKNLSIPRVPPQPAFRATLAEVPTTELFARLEAIDPESAAMATQHDRVRLIRTLEIAAFTGEQPSALKRQAPCAWDVFKIGIWVDPAELDARIAARTEAIWQAGFLDEVRALRAQGHDEHTPALIAHGYREAIAHLRGELTAERAKELMTRNTRRYAKRQRTWWRRDTEMVWVEV